MEPYPRTKPREIFGTISFFELVCLTWFQFSEKNNQIRIRDILDTFISFQIN